DLARAAHVRARVLAEWRGVGGGAVRADLRLERGDLGPGERHRIEDERDARRRLDLGRERGELVLVATRLPDRLEVLLERSDERVGDGVVAVRGERRAVDLEVRRREPNPYARDVGDRLVANVGRREDVIERTAHEVLRVGPHEIELTLEAEDELFVVPHEDR